MSDESEMTGSAKETVIGIPGGDVTERPGPIDVSEDVKHVIEALVFASDEPLSVKLIKTILENNGGKEGEEEYSLDPSHIASAVAILNEEYRQSQRPYRIVQLGGGYIFATEKNFAVWVGKLFKERARRKLTQTAIETLAIIAYKQPITKSEVEFIRGVNADYIMKALLEKGLVTIVGRATTPGRPLLYGTTPQFLIHFGLNEITDLPKPREIEELLGETELEVEKRMLAEQQEINFKEELEEKKETQSRAPHIPMKKSALQKPKDEGATPAPRVQFPVTSPEGPTIKTDDRGTSDIPEIEPSDNVVASEEIQIVHDSSATTDAPEIHEVIEHHEIHSAVTQSDESLRMEQPLEEQKIPDPVLADSPNTFEEREGSIPAKDVMMQSVSGAEADTARTSDSFALKSENEFSQNADENVEKGWSKWKVKIQTFFRKLFG